MRGRRREPEEGNVWVEEVVANIKPRITFRVQLCFICMTMARAQKSRGCECYCREIGIQWLQRNQRVKVIGEVLNCEQINHGLN